MRIIRFGFFILIYLNSFLTLTMAGDEDIFKEKIDFNLEQKIAQNVQRIKEGANISRKQEMKLHKAINETNINIKREEEIFKNMINEMGKGVVPICEKCLKDPDINIRKNAMYGLGARMLQKEIEYREHGRIENEENRIEDEAIVFIAMRAVKDKDKSIRKSGVYMLWSSLKGFIKYDPVIIEVLKKVKQGDEDKNVRQIARNALRQLGIRDAFTDEEWRDLEEHGVIID